jgi:hypothetical protein
MDTGERRLLDPSELPTKPSIRLPLPPLPPSLPRVPRPQAGTRADWADEDGGPTHHPPQRVPGGFPAATGTSPGPAAVVVRREVGHGGG